MITLAKGHKPKDEPKVGKAKNQNDAEKVCAPKYLPSGDWGSTTRQRKIRRQFSMAKKSPRRRHNEHETARIKEAHRVPTGTNSALL